MERYPCTRFQNMIRHVIKQTSKHKEDDRLKSSKSLAETPSCQHQKNHFLSSYLFLDCGLILCFLTSTPIGLDGISFFSVLCAGMNILCKHVQMCVCVCALRHVRGHGNGDGQHEIWSCHQSLGNSKVCWSPMSTGFIILIKTCIKPGRVPEMDLGIWLYVRKVLGTPRHPSVNGYLPPCAFVCV